MRDKNSFFRSKIYHKRLNFRAPTYSILSNEEGFGVPEAEKRVRSGEIKNIFLLFAGQQGHYGTGEKVDDFYCRNFTGSHRIKESGKLKWSSGYKIFTSKEHDSVASRLFDRYDKNSLIINVLNTQYYWGHRKGKKEELISRFFGELGNIFDGVGEMAEGRFFICGFSRGGVFSIKTGGILKETYGSEKISAIVTLDPVINPLSREKTVRESSDSIVYDIALKVRTLEKMKIVERWTTVKSLQEEKRPFLKSFSIRSRFPVLKKVEGVTHYNVFQRKSMRRGFLTGKFGKVPVGAAVDGAISPAKSKKWQGVINTVSERSPFDQYDTDLSMHGQEIIEKYKEWILDIAFEVMR